MGALHAGHAKLIETARLECEFVVVSIFVNPLQFGPSEDFSRYPRAFSSDYELCGKSHVDVVFAPSVEEMYPQEQLTVVDVGKISEHLCGRFRVGHFRGVATVVLKLFNIIRPDRAYFGEKDLQQLAVIRRMARDLALPVEIVGVPTMREPDGLAMSSRNQYLTPEERRASTVLYRALVQSRAAVRNGTRDASAIRAAGLAVLEEEPPARLQYFEIVDQDLQPIAEMTETAYAAGAVFLGNTRLIDNIRLESESFET